MDVEVEILKTKNILVSLLLVLSPLVNVVGAQKPPSVPKSPSNEAAIKPMGYNWSHTEGNVLAVSFSSDGQTAVSVDSEGLVKFWNTTTGRMVRSIAHGAPIVAAAFYGNKKIALAKGREGENAIVIQEVTTGKQIETLSGHTRNVTTLAFSPHGEAILSGGSDQFLMLWDVQYGQMTDLFRGHEGAIRAVAFSPDGTQIISSSADRAVKIWDMATREEMLSFYPHKDIATVAFSPDSQKFLSAGLDKVKPARVHSVKLWERSKKKWWQIRKKPLLTLGEYAEPITAAAFSPDGKRILIGTQNGKMDIWEIATGKNVQSFEENQGAVRTGIFSRDGRFVLTAGEGKLNLWKIAEASSPSGVSPAGGKQPAPKRQKGKGKR